MRLAVAAPLLLVAAACGRVAFDPLGQRDGSSGDDDAGGDDATVGSISVPSVSSTVVTGGTASTTISFGTGPAIGDVIIVSAWTFDVPTTTLPAGAVTDDAGNTYSVAVTNATATGGCTSAAAAAAAIFYAPVTATATPLTLTITPTGSGTLEIGAAAIAAHGISLLDDFVSFNIPGAPSPTTISAGSVHLSASDGLLVSVANACSGYPNVASWTENRGFVVRVENGATMTTEPGIVADRIVSGGPADFDEEWTFTWAGASQRPAIGAFAVFR